MSQDKESRNAELQPAAASHVICTKAPGQLLLEAPTDGRTLKIFYLVSVVWWGLTLWATTGATRAIAARGNRLNDFLGYGAPLFMMWLVAIGFAFVTVALRRSRLIIAVQNRQLTVVEAGLFKTKRQSWHVNDIAAVCLGPGRMVNNETAVPELQVVPRGHVPIGISDECNEAVIEWMAAQIRQALDVPATYDPALGDRLEQPISSDIRCETGPERLTLHVPRAGMWRGNRWAIGGWFLACLFATGFAVVWIQSDKPVADEGNTSVIAIAGLFWLALAMMIVSAWIVGRRQSTIEANATCLVIREAGAFASATNDWLGDDIASIVVRPSQRSYYGRRPAYELQITSKDGKTFRLLAGRDTDELTWIATLLRRSLEIPIHGG